MVLNDRQNGPSELNGSRRLIRRQRHRAHKDLLFGKEIALWKHSGDRVGGRVRGMTVNHSLCLWNRLVYFKVKQNLAGSRTISTYLAVLQVDQGDIIDG